MKVLVAGDYCPQNRVSSLFEQSQNEAVLGQISSIIKETDYSIVNLECPIIKGGEAAIVKHGPSLFCKESGIKALAWVGFQCVTLANNHFYDYGDEGVKNTIQLCDKYSIDHVGGGRSINEAAAIFYKRIGNKTLAIINCCEHEFSIATSTTGGSNPLNPIQQYYAITEAKKNADYILVIVHGGHELFQLPSPRMQELYRFFVDCGADAVVNHHQHCYSGFEVYKDRPIFYGLGNFCFDESNSLGRIWNEGFLVELFFDNSVSFKLIPYIQCDVDPKVVLLPPTSFDSTITNLNFIINNGEALSNKVNEYYESCNKQSSFIFEPLMNRIYTSLRYRGIMPSLVSKKRKILATDFIGCESHRDKLLSYLTGTLED